MTIWNLNESIDLPIAIADVDGLQQQLDSIPSALDDLANVAAADPTDGQVVAWDATEQAWVPVDLPEPSAGGGDPIAVDDDGVEVVAEVSRVNFADNLDVTDDGAGAVTIVGQPGLDLSDVGPQPLGDAAPGTSPDVSRADHVHPFGTLDQITLSSPDGTVWTVTVDNTGTLQTAALGVLLTEAGDRLTTEAGDLLLLES